MCYHGDFGGTMYLAESNQWSVYHPMQDNGKVGGEMSMDLIALGGNNMDSKETLSAAAGLGLAAGKIYFKFSNAETRVESGFWLEGGYFVTCTHFWSEHTPTEPPYEAIVQNIRERTVLARVSSKMFSRRLGNVGWTFENVTRRNAKTFVSVIGTDDVLVELVSENKEADMAIFRTRGKPHSHFVKRGDLYSLEHSCTDLPSAIWSVGYNGNDMPIEQVPLHQDWSQKAAAMKPKPTTAFEYIIRLYEQSLMKSNGWASTLDGVTGNGEHPSFNEFYCPDIRALAVGKLYNPTSEEKITTLETAQLKPLTIKRRHTISGFWGCSGAMIGAFPLRDTTSPKVIGLFSAGTFGQPSNAFRAFTRAGIEWICRETTVDTPPSIGMSNLDIDPKQHYVTFGGSTM